MDNGTFGMLGLCRKAKKLSMGHDACKAAVTSGKAKLCLICSDSSQRVFEEFETLCERSCVALFRISPTIDEMHHIIGYKSGIITINDENFADSVIKKLKQNRSGEEDNI